MSKKLRPFMFTKTIIAWGKTEEEARQSLKSAILEEGDDMIFDWSCDELSIDDVDSDREGEVLFL